ncbi:MAG: hypothetical protein GY862_23320 [Gammaproteobacteria bacterium]|nr:hypothetical protein [Gammaproteobacteria bacterium]
MKDWRSSGTGAPEHRGIQDRQSLKDWRSSGTGAPERLKVTTPLNGTLSEYVEITHPFHPLKGQRFQVLKSSRIAGRETLIFKNPAGGTFAVDKDWTDRADFSPLENTQFPHVFLDFHCLLEIAEMMEKL